MAASAGDRLDEAVTALFVPGDRPERFPKALGSGADLVILDLEDAVADEARETAMAAVIAELGRPGDGVLVRLPGAQERSQVRAIEMLVHSATGRLLGVMLPKAEDPEQVKELSHRMNGILVLPLIETARGVLAADRIAGADGVARLAFGAIDFALDVDAADGAPPLDMARSQLVVASRAAGLPPPLDSPPPEIRDLESVAACARRSRSFGFGGSLCIHPAQLAPIRSAFVPGPDEVAWAQRVLAAPGGATQVDGRMVDRPVVDRARRILARTRRGRMDR